MKAEKIVENMTRDTMKCMKASTNTQVLLKYRAQNLAHYHIIKAQMYESH